MFAFIESAVGDALEKLGVMGQRTNMAPVDVIRAVSEVIAARSIKRDGHPEDLIGALVFLASGESDFVAGQTLAVCGGTTST